MNIVNWLLQEMPGSYVTREYGMGYHPILKTYKLHTGIDIGGLRQGTPLPAVVDGTVSGTGYSSAWGHWIGITGFSKDFVYFYAHMHGQLRKIGDTLKRGDPVGPVGSTGLSTGTHLHFEIRKWDGTPNGGVSWGNPRLFTLPEEETDMEKTPVKIEGDPRTYEAYIFKGADGTFKTFVELRDFAKAMDGSVTHLGTLQGTVVFKPTAVEAVDKELLLKVHKFTSSLNDLLEI